MHDIELKKPDEYLTVKRIETFKDLVEEEQRLTMKLKRDKAVMSTGFYQLKAKIEPASEALGYMNNLFGVKEKPGIVASGVDMFIDLFAKKYLFKRSGWLVTLVGSYAVRGLSQFFMKKKRKLPGSGWENGQEPVIDAQEARIRAEQHKHNGKGGQS